jgi:hypothetical protein
MVKESDFATLTNNSFSSKKKLQNSVTKWECESESGGNRDESARDCSCTRSHSHSVFSTPNGSKLQLF